MNRERAYSHLLSLREAIAAAMETDRLVPLWLPYTGVALLAVSLLMQPPHRGEGASTTYLKAEVATAAFIAGAVLLIYTVYLLVKRLGDHFSRVHRLYAHLQGILDSLGIADPETVIIREKVSEMLEAERPRSPVLWAAAFAVFTPVAIYIAHFLNKDLARHEERERSILRNLSRILEKRGITLAEPERTVPDRSTAVYLALTIATLGFFSLYWLYTLVEDGNRHLLQHRAYERELADVLERLIEKPI